LIKTHCAGYNDVGNYRTSKQSYEQFVQGCTRFDAPNNININNNNDLSSRLTLTQETHYVKGYYNVSQIRGVVHLIRNPINNLVSRMHMGVRRRWGRWNETERNRFNLLVENNNYYNNTATREGVLAWCHFTDASFWKDDAKHQKNVMNSTSSDNIRWFRETPCHAELFRYSQWHNRALELIRRQNLSSIRLYYEDYANDDKVFDLLEYLQLAALESSPLPFDSQKNYQDLFTRKHRKRMVQFLQKLATNETWNMLKRYF
jgi:hypothetical protein